MNKLIEILSDLKVLLTSFDPFNNIIYGIIASILAVLILEYIRTDSKKQKIKKFKKELKQILRGAISGENIYTNESHMIRMIEDLLVQHKLKQTNKNIRIIEICVSELTSSTIKKLNKKLNKKRRTELQKQLNKFDYIRTLVSKINPTQNILDSIVFLLTYYILIPKREDEIDSENPDYNDDDDPLDLNEPPIHPIPPSHKRDIEGEIV